MREIVSRHALNSFLALSQWTLQVWPDGDDGHGVSIVALKWLIRSDTVLNRARAENELLATLRTWSRFVA